MARRPSFAFPASTTDDTSAPAAHDPPRPTGEGGSGLPPIGVSHGVHLSLATGHPEEAERCMQAVEQTLGTEMTELYAEGEEAKAMAPAIRGALVEVATVRSQLAIGGGDTVEALKLARLALLHLEDDEAPYLHNPPIDSRTIVFFIMGLAHKSRGELGLADKAFTEAGVLAQERDNVHIVAGTLGRQASVQAIQGHLRQAVRTCQRGLSLVQEMRLFLVYTLLEFAMEPVS